MELDDLKKTWALVDERLKENEMLNKRLVQEMLRDKSNKSLNKLVNTELFNLITLLFIIPICIWGVNTRYINLLFPKLVFVAVFVVAIYGIIFGSYVLRKYLLKIDFSKSIKDNMYYLNKFIIYYRKGKMINYYIVIPIFYLLGILSYYELKAPFYLWIFLFATFTIGIVGTYLIYKRVYDVSIQSIQKSLDELSELKEE